MRFFSIGFSVFLVTVLLVLSIVPASARERSRSPRRRSRSPGGRVQQPPPPPPPQQQQPPQQPPQQQQPPAYQWRSMPPLVDKEQ